MSCSTSLIVALTLATALPGSSATGVADAAGSTPLSFPFQNVTLGLEQRIDDLLSRMTVKEKIGQMFMNSKMAFGNDVVPKGGDLPSTAIPRLGVGEFIFMGDGNVYRGAGNGCNIGCCSCYNPPTCTGGVCCCVDQAATQFPQGTGVAATWNLPLVFKMGVVASDESWALQNRPNASQAPTDYRSGASSVINILRDGRWGRAPETYGECPHLTGEVAVALNKGLTGFATLNATVREHGDRIKILTNLRHFVAYAGPDSQRFHFNAVVNDDDLRYTYLPAWKKLVETDTVSGVMSAISGLNGIPSAAHKALLTDTLRGEWNFEGYVVSDCDTISAIATSFHYTASVEQATAMAVKAGGDLNCGPEYSQLINATAHGFITEAELDISVRRLMRRRIQIGDLDAKGADGKPQSPYAKIPTTLIDTPEHQQIAHQVVKESVVMLTNGKTTPAADAARVLPMDPKSLKTVLVVGPTANDITVQAHTYHGTPSQWVTILDGINSTLQSQAPHVSLTYIQGCDRTSTGTSAKAGFAKATAAVAQADAVIFVGGLQASMEEEGTDRVNDMGHPGVQLDLIKALHSAAQAKSSRIPLVVVTVSGGPVAERYLGMDPMGTQGTAWLWLSYFGQDGGGVADVIFGAYSPSGRTPFSVPTSHSQLGDIADYSMVQSGGYGRTYRYNRYANATAAPMFPFCHGLSYANLSMTLSINSSTASIGDTVNASVAISRYDDMSIAQDVVVALFGEFLTDNEGTSPVTALPVRQLVKFEKVTVPAGARANAASVHLVFTMTEDALPGVDRQPWPGTLKLWVGDGGGYGGSMAPQRKVATAAELATLHLQL